LQILSGQEHCSTGLVASALSWLEFNGNDGPSDIFNSYCGVSTVKK